MATQHIQRISEHAVGPDGEHNETLASVPEQDVNDPCHRFKLIGILAKAIQRWQASINPKVDFRKRSSSVRETPSKTLKSGSSSGGRRVLSAPVPESKRLLLGPNRSASGGRPIGRSGPPDTPSSSRKMRANRGHMTSYLFQPLPDPQHRRQESN